MAEISPARRRIIIACFGPRRRYVYRVNPLLQSRQSRSVTHP
jgi:hypothetical protein